VRFWRRPSTPLPPDPGCREVAAVLQSYLDGELEAGDADKVAGHLEACGRCGIAEATTRRVIAAIRRQRPDLDAAPLERLAGFVGQLTHAVDGEDD
jgi:anti-sigma factor RsiW